MYGSLITCRYFALELFTLAIYGLAHAFSLTEAVGDFCALYYQALCSHADFVLFFGVSEFLVFLL